MIMPVAVGIHGNGLDRVIETYNLMSEGYFTHASPTLFNAGTPHPQLSSCFLICMKDNSIEDGWRYRFEYSLYSGNWACQNFFDCSMISYFNLGHTNVYSNGTVPMLCEYDVTARHVDQGNKLPGAFAIYLEPWHVDILYLNFCTFEKTTVKSRSVVYFMLSGFQMFCETNSDWYLLHLTVFL